MRKLMILMILFSSLLIAKQQDDKYAVNKSANEETNLVDSKIPESNSDVYKKTDSKIENQGNKLQQHKKSVPPAASSLPKLDTSDLPVCCGCCAILIIVAIFYSVMP